MKKIIQLILLLVCANVASQTQSQNYILTKVYQQAYNPTAGQGVDDYRVTVQYSDGLGRPIQTIAYQAGGANQDIITPITYDSYGRQIKSYLPYVANQGNSLNYRDNQVLTGIGAGSVAQFYLGKYPADLLSTNINAYSETRYENSPLNRVMEQAAPGKSWLLNPTADTDNTIKTEYQTNGRDEVANFSVAFGTTNGVEDTEKTSLVYNGSYPIYQLYVKVTKDENWKPSTGNLYTTREYTDKEGRLILKRTYNTEPAGRVGTEIAALDTYYVYDDFGNLTYVIPPVAANTILRVGLTATTIVTAVENTMCYIYHYDKRNRMVEKFIPDNGWTHIVYDKLDRPILTQSEKQRAAVSNNWLFTRYDAFDRPAYTGQLTSLNQRTALQNQVSTANYPLSENRTSTSQFQDSGNDVYYSNLSFPAGLITGAIDISSVAYYDTYIPGVTVPAAVLGDNLTTTLNTLPTVSHSKISGSAGYKGWIKTVNGYDKKGRATFNSVNNTAIGTRKIVHTKLDFLGKPVQSKAYNSKVTPGGLYETDKILTDNFTYDYNNRLVKQTQQLSGLDVFNPPGEKVIAQNEYDELGQLIKKNVGGSIISNTVGLQQVDYTYNIRGWLKDINDVSSSNTNDLFAFALRYDVPYTGNSDVLFNGNISETHWKYKGEARKMYSYFYDGLNRLKESSFSDGDGIYDEYYTNKYDEGAIGYDRNGNITTLERKGYRAATGVYDVIDKLTYRYMTNSNKLLSVTDTGTTDGFKDVGTALTTDYTYDANGNMLTDANKGIESITYNYLNLPTRISFGGRNVIEYTYDASGVKTQKKVFQSVQNGVSETTTDYANGFVYENNVLKFISHPEGYIDCEGGYKYVYQYKDHLGNTRLSYDEKTETTASYPFNSSTEGFVVKAGATAVVQSGALVVSATAAYAGVRKNITNTAQPGDRYRFTLIVDRATTDVVRIFISEAALNSSTWQEYTPATLASGQQTITFDYVVNANPIINLSLDKTDASAQIGTTTTFRILDLKVSKITTNVLEKNDYYAFGLKHTVPGEVINSTNIALKYKYNGKELQDELGLGIYDFGLRQYDPAIGRMLQIDPVTHHNQSPYVAFNNNPVVFVDPDGADAIDPVKESVTMITSTVDKSNVTHITQTTTNTTTTYGEDGSVNVSYSTSSITNTVDAYGNVTNGNSVTTSSGSMTKDSEGKVSATTGKTTTREAKAGDASSALGEWTSTVSSYNKSHDSVYNVDMINKTADRTTQATKAGMAVLGNVAGFNNIFSKLSKNSKGAIGVLGSYTSAEGLVGTAGEALKDIVGKNNSYAIIYGVQHIQNGSLIKPMKTPSGVGGGQRDNGPKGGYSELFNGIVNLVKNLF